MIHEFLVVSHWQPDAQLVLLPNLVLNLYKLSLDRINLSKQRVESCVIIIDSGYIQLGHLQLIVLVEFLKVGTGLILLHL